MPLSDNRDDKEEDMTENLTVLPMLPLRDIIIFPHMVVPLFVGRERSINALDEAMNKDKQLFLAAQKDAKIQDPDEKDGREGRVPGRDDRFRHPDAAPSGRDREGPGGRAEEGGAYRLSLQERDLPRAGAGYGGDRGRGDRGRGIDPEHPGRL